MRPIPLHPAHPERVCWGCDKYCPAGDLSCGNGSERTPHPEELFGTDWQEWACEGATQETRQETRQETQQETRDRT